jgi:hypothetical protein
MIEWHISIMKERENGGEGRRNDRHYILRGPEVGRNVDVTVGKATCEA